MLIGYVCARADDVEALAAQRQVLRDAGCEQITEGLMAERRGEQPELHRVLGTMHASDVIIVPELDCLGRSLPDVVRRMQRIASAGAGLRSHKEGIDTTSADGRAAARVIGGLAGLDQGDRGQRIATGLAAARASGRKLGRPKLTEQQRAVVGDEVLSGRQTAARMAKRYKVSQATVSRIVTAYRTKTGATEGNRLSIEDTVEGKGIAGTPPISSLDERLAIVGTSGLGKTYAAKGLVEQL